MRKFFYLKSFEISLIVVFLGILGNKLNANTVKLETKIQINKKVGQEILTNDLDNLLEKYDNLSNTLSKIKND